jgi:hypothetical protein
MLIGASFWLSKQFRWDSTTLLTCFISNNFLTALIWESILCGASFAEAPGKSSYLCLFMQTLLNAKGQPVIVGIGGPSGSGKTSFAHKMANIVGCEVVSMESYYKAEEVKDSNYDEFSTLDLPLLLKVCVCFQHPFLHIK